MPRRRLRSSVERALVAAWYAPRPTLLSWLLLPLSGVFAAVVATRRALYRAGVLRAVAVGVPVIVVGNITAGGTGKTPLVRHLARALREAGRRPGVVSRGHGARRPGVRAVAAADHARDVGDEALLYAADGLPVFVGADRAAAAAALRAAHPEVDVILADDGLQHYRLARAIEVAVIDAERGVGNGLMLPAGPLREPVGRLARVDAVVRNGVPRDGAPRSAGPGPGATAPAAELPHGVPLHAMTLEPGPIRSLVDPARTADPAHFAAGRNVAVAGIGNPSRFFATLAALGVRAEPRAFPDHHPYTREDVAFPDAEAILMTEKDAVKCRDFADDRFWVVPVGARVEPPLLPLLEKTLHGP